MSFKPIDPKRDEIRRYLERGSVLDSLTKIFIRVIKERPENPMEYIRNNIGVVRNQHDKYERLQQDLQLANDEIQRLRGIINSINPEVLQGQQQPPLNQSETSSDDSEPVTVTEQAEAVNDNQSGEVKPEANGEAVPAGAAAEEELAAAVEQKCQIAEKPTAMPDIKNDMANQPSSSVQAESTE